MAQYTIGPNGETFRIIKSEPVITHQISEDHKHMLLCMSATSDNDFLVRAAGADQPDGAGAVAWIFGMVPVVEAVCHTIDFLAQ